MTTPEPPRAPGPSRFCAPFAPLAVAFAVGILADRFLWGGPTLAWAGLAAAAGALVALRPRAISPAIAFLALGGAWNHAAWSDLAPEDLARADWSAPRPAWVRGAIVEGPRLRAPEPPQTDPTTSLVLKVAAISDGATWHRASGRIAVLIRGDRSDLRSGDPVFAAGSLAAIPGPRNPGEADARERRRAEGIRLRMSVGDPPGVWPDPEGSPDRLHRWLGQARRVAHERLVAGLPPDVAALASALILGRREAVDPDLNDAFARTGTTHLLAISGLHLQALAGALLVLLSAMGVRPKRAYALVAAATILYTLLVGASPSALRSTVMTVTLCVAAMRDRCAAPANRLALAALLTLAVNPAYLFDAGCQLSFLAIAALFWTFPLVWHPEPAPVPDDQSTPKGRLDALERRLEGPWRRWARWFARDILVKGLVASVVVWLAAIPLVALRFHTVSPVGVLLNLPLIPVTSLALFLGGASLALSLIWGPLGLPAAWLCGVLLRWTMLLVNAGASLRGGWWFTPGPSMVGVAIFYSLLTLATLASLRRWRARRLAWAAAGLGFAALAAAPFLPHRPGRVSAEVLAVDHGLSVIVQGADGRIVLYDCGKMRDARVGRRVIAPALWARGVSRIESVLLSHADSDHYNGLPDLLDRFSIGEVRVPPGFGGSHNPEAERLLALVRSRGVPIREIARGDRIALDGGEIAILHPPRGWDGGGVDNARSVVALVSGEGRGEGLLLTGDLEGSGLLEFAKGPRPRFASMLSPHHGARAANPEWFLTWASPRCVLASQERPRAPSRDALVGLEARGVAVRRTWREGALRVDLGGESVRPSRAELVAAIAPLGPRAALTIAGGVLGLMAVVVLAVMEWGAWTLVMPGRRLAHAEAEPAPWGPIEAVAPDGVRLHGAMLRLDESGSPAPPASGTVVFLHGFGEDRAAMRGRAESLAARGWTVAVLDTRGRGRSEGDRTAFGGREAADLHAWLDALEGAGAPMLAWGRSMGAAIAARAAVEDARIAGVILEAPYADLRSAVGAWIARLRLPRWLAGPILWRARHLAGVSLRDPRPIQVAPRVKVPALILHGESDPVVPPGEARRLASAFGGWVEVVEVPEAHHNDVFDRGGGALAERIAAWAEAVRAGGGEEMPDG